MLDAIKARFAQFFGEGSSEVTKEALLDGVAFADLLPYDAFDEETGVFVNKGSLGFVLEAIPLVGNPVIEKMLFFLVANQKCYPSQLGSVFFKSISIP